MFRVSFLAFCFAFAMGMPDRPPMRPNDPPLLIRVEACCAKELMKRDDLDKDVLKECFQKDIKPYTCERDIYIAKMKGYASSDGTIDRKATQEILEKDFKDNTVALESILENCVNGDLSKFGREDFCELTKLNICIEVQAIKTCDDWKESEDCKMLKTQVDSIIKKFE